MQFYIGRHFFSIKREESFGITNSYKMPVEFAEKLAVDTGWEFNIYQNEDRRVSLCAYVAA
jgi:hypothetical protein